MSKFTRAVWACSPIVAAALAAQAFAADTAQPKAKATKPAAGAVKVAAKPLAAKPSPEATRLETYTRTTADGKAEGEAYFALSLMPQKTPASQVGTDIVVMFDTSASQAGDFRTKGLATLSGMLEGLGPKDRVMLISVDLNAVPMTDKFVAAQSSEMKSALAKLVRRVPLGTTDLPHVVRDSIKSFDDESKANRALVYIGDGISNSNEDGADLKSFIAPLVEGKIAVSSFAIGPQLDVATLAAIANQTGGTVAVDNEKLSAKEFGLHLAAVSRESVIWPTRVSYPKEMGEVYPAQAPLRGDRDTVLIGRGVPKAEFDVAIDAEVDGKPVNMKWTVKPVQPHDDHSYLAQLVDAAKSDSGASLPTLGSDGLWESRRMVHQGTYQLVKLGKQAVAGGNADQAKQLAAAAMRRDPSNTNAIALRGALDKSTKTAAGGKDAGELRIVKRQAPEALPPVAGTPDESTTAETSALDAYEQERQLAEKILAAEVAAALNDARARVRTEPVGVHTNLKTIQQRVMDAPELRAETRAALRNQLEAAIAQAARQIDEKAVSDAIKLENLATARERLRVLSELERAQNATKNLTDRFNSLLTEGRYVEAEEEAAVEIRALNPDTPIGVSATLIARMTGYHMANLAVREATQKAYMDTLHLVDRSHIPFPDEPPIVYADATVWKALSESRKKYANVDLKSSGGAEQRIARALTEPTKLEFVETPLEGVIEFLQDYHQIPIQLDEKALEAAGVPKETPITRNLQGISLRSALRLMLKQLELTYIIQDEVLQITSPEAANEKQVTKVYPVADLVLPIQQSGFMGGFGGLGGGQGNGFGNGGVGAQGFGGGGAGGFGGGGGGFGGGLGGGGFGMNILDDLNVLPPVEGGIAFAVADDLKISAKKPTDKKETVKEADAKAADAKAAEPKAAVAKPAAVKATVKSVTPVKPEAPATKDVEDAKQIVEKTIKGTKPGKVQPLKATAQAGQDLETAWSLLFMQMGEPTHKDEIDNQRVIRERRASIRETARLLMTEKKYDELVAMLRAALRHGYPQPWMYEAMGLAMQAAEQSPEEIERALMSAVDFSGTTDDLLVVASYLTRVPGLDPRALKLFRQVSRVEPARHEPYVQGLAIAKRLNDIEGIKWACVGILNQAWPNDKAEVLKEAQASAQATVEQLQKDKRIKEATAFKTALDEALVRDCRVKISWNGPADVDLLVEEPTGTVCSARNPRTTSGGVMLGDTFARSEKANGNGYAEEYVVPQGFSGTYKLLVRRIFGKITADRVTIDIYTNVNGKNPTHVRKSIPLGDKDALVLFDVKDGRRQEPLAEQQVAVAAAGQIAMNRSVLAQQIDSLTSRSAVADLAAARAARQDPLGFFRGRGAVGFQPVISTLPEGTNLAATAVISADRRYVRITALPLFSVIGDVQTFNFSTGQSATEPGNNGPPGQGGGAVP